MSCDLKSNVKLTSNIIHHNAPIGHYIPVDLKPNTDLDSRLSHQLTPAQQKQHFTRLFYAKEVRDTNIRFFDLPENKELCSNCPYKDICY